jgi:hypothetical protein
MVGSHVVPRFYLEQFAVKKRKSARTGHLWVYSKELQPRQGTARSEGVENGYFAYPLPTGGVDESVENRLAILENTANDLLVMAPSECFVWSAQYRRIMADYVGLMFARSRGRLEGSSWVHAKVSELMRRLQQEGFYREIASEYGSKHSQNISAEGVRRIWERLADSNTSKNAVKRGFIEDLLLNAQLVTDQILRKSWQLWCARDTTYFVTSDTPVVTAMPSRGELTPGFGFAVPGVVAFFPLSPRACLVMGERGPEHRHVVAEKVNKVNDLVIKLMRKHVYSQVESARIEEGMKQYGGQVQFGKTAFVPQSDNLMLFKRIIRMSLGLRTT